MQSLLRNVRCAYLILRHRLADQLSFQAKPCLAQLSPMPLTESGSTLTPIEELMRDGTLWGVPKKRPTVERRLKRRFGVPNYPDNTFVLRRRTDLIICEHCGDHHEAFTICRTCYQTVREETNRLKEDIRSQTNPLEPKEKEVVVRFQNDPKDSDGGQHSHKYRIVEVPRDRPAWFASNLLVQGSGRQRQVKGVNTRPEDLVSFKND